MAKRAFPRSRKEGLVIEELKDETLVYELDRNKAHCLDQTAVWIWKQCDGKTSVSEIARRMQKHLGSSVDEDVVWVGLKRLSKAGLLEERIQPPSGILEGRSRRDLLKKVALVGGIGVLSILVPSAAQAASACVSCHNAIKNGVSEIGKCCKNNPALICCQVHQCCQPGCTSGCISV
ncbi:MAG: PqqD family protein [Acidobacteriia bacterium]|nr:PqqD family protein [Terriglobia bacterium]